jgi:hypothetical protein
MEIDSMAMFSYTPDPDLKVHQEGAIRLICQSFRSHENGLPEWCKNSSDAYVREDTAQDLRIVVVLFSNARDGKPATISCLDFVGMTSEQIEGRFRHWADPDAAAAGLTISDVQGGHGNGGKCYMTQMFEDHSYIYTVKKGKGNLYGVQSGSFRFGYIPAPDRGKDFVVKDIRREIEKALGIANAKVQDLPMPVQERIQNAQGFSLVVGIAPKDVGGKIPVSELVDTVVNHQQMIRTMELCKVYVVVDGRKFNHGKSLSLPEIPPMEGAAEPRLVVLPEMLIDPKFEREVSTTKNGSFRQGTLTLKTSDRSMRWQRKYRHSIAYRSTSGYIGAIEIPELGVQSTYADRIYGECSLESLDNFKTNERRRLADSPLTRAVEAWIRSEVESYAKEFELRDKRKIDQQEKDSVSKMNEALDKWKNQFLQSMMDTLWGAGKEGPPSPPLPPHTLPSGKPARVELSLSHNRAGVGVALKPSLKFYDKKGQRIRPIPYTWISDDTNVALVDENLLTINTFSFGKTQIYAETIDGRMKSNPVQLEVVHVYNIEIVPDHAEIPSGSKGSLTAICTLQSGEQTSDVYLVWTEGNSKIARVGPSGVVFGFEAGETDVTAGDNHCLSKKAAKITVTPSDGSGTGSSRGKGFPLILISEINPDPETGEEIKLSAQDPPVYQRPQDYDRNIWWVNSASPFARMYLDNTHYGSESREWRIYLLERYLEVMVKIVLNFDMAAQGNELSFENWMQRWDETAANMQQFASESLASFIDSGVLPGNI